MSAVIKVENLSKAYQLGQIGTGTISRDLERYWARIRGKEDPFLKIGETNDQSTKATSDVVWSLKDLNFDIEEGDAVGIIGKNGAGKSTLLKILSRVTAPTTGSAKIKGRIASLLEVGTGFHPELSGRENIYLNGAILGMRKAEIKRKFDEIVDFSGVERYIDTPVKRYSSGMYVRLAFAVAAHLESEILIVDEVLAVGDAEFQKKCLGKMSDVSKGEGRTILFVSHNMSLINQLCLKTIYLDNGTIFSFANTNLSIDSYLSNQRVSVKNELEYAFNKDESNEYISLEKFRVLPHFNDSNNFFSDRSIQVTFDVNITKEILGLRIGFEVIHRASEQCVFRTFHDDLEDTIKSLKKGALEITGYIPEDLLNEGEYILYPTIGIHNIKWFSFKTHLVSLDIINLDGLNKSYS
jgi:lipopolysaccharide transport system ATP-binding protein